MAKIVEVRTVHGDGQANKLMEEDWELYAALDPIPKFGVNSPHGERSGASYVLVRREEKSGKMVSLKRMGDIPKFAELQALTDDELISRYDYEAEHTLVGTGFYLNELARREEAKQTAKVVDFTKEILKLTNIITYMTLINVVLVAVTLLREAL
jgi:hypothetical protein